jgi:hypothetical protein
MIKFSIFIFLFLVSQFSFANANEKYILKMQIKFQKNLFNSQKNVWEYEDISALIAMDSRGHLEIQKNNEIISSNGLHSIWSHLQLWQYLEHMKIIKNISHQDGEDCMGHSSIVRPQNIILSLIQPNGKEIILDNSGACRLSEKYIIRPAFATDIEFLWKIEDDLKAFIP